MIKRNSGFIKVVSFVCAFATAFSMLVPAECLRVEAARKTASEQSVVDTPADEFIPSQPVYKAKSVKQILHTGDVDLPEGHKVNPKKPAKVDEDVVFDGVVRDDAGSPNEHGAPAVDEVFTRSPKNGYNALTANQKAIYNLIDTAATTFMTSTEDYTTTRFNYSDGTRADEYVFGEIDFSGISNEGVAATIKDAVFARAAYDFDHPAYYWISSGFAKTSTSISLFTYAEFAKASSRAAINSLVAAGIKKYAATAGAGGTTIEKVRILHDEICQDVKYAEDAGGNPISDKWAHSVIGVFDKSHSAVVCEGYADAFAAVLNYMQIPNYYIVGDSSGEGTGGGGRHAWNAFSADGGTSYMYADLTWDDIDPSAGGGFLYAYFGMPKTTFESSHTADTAASYTTSGNRWLYDLPATITTGMDGLYYKSAGLYYGVDSTQTATQIAEEINTKTAAWTTFSVLSDSTDNLRALLDAIKGSSFGNFSCHTKKYENKNYYAYVFVDKNDRYSKPVTGFELSKSVDTVNISRGTYTFTIDSLEPADYDEQLFITSSDTGIASVDNPYIGKDDSKSVTVSLHGVGTTTITVKNSSGTMSRPLSLTVEQKPTPVVMVEPTLEGVYGTAVKDLTPTGGDVTVEGSWAVANAEDTTIPHVANPGKARVIFTPSDLEHYSTISIDAQIHLTEKPISLVVDNKTMEERSSAPEFSLKELTVDQKAELVGTDKELSISGLQSLLGITFTCVDGEGKAIDSSTAVGEYDIDASETSTDYAVSFTKGKLTVEEYRVITPFRKADPVVTGTYGDKVRDLQVTGGAVQVSSTDTTPVEGEWEIYGTNLDSVLHVNTLDFVFLRFNPSSDRYNAITKQLVPVITPRPITVTIKNDKKMIKGESVPTFTDEDWTITGGTLVEGDTKGDLRISLKTEATSGSDPGTYAITKDNDATTNEDYDVTYVNGTITVALYETRVGVAPTLTGTYGAKKILGDGNLTIGNQDATKVYKVVDGVETKIDGTWTIKDPATESSSALHVASPGSVTMLFTPNESERPASFGEITAEVVPSITPIALTVKIEDKENSTDGEAGYFYRIERQGASANPIFKITIDDTNKNMLIAADISKSADQLKSLFGITFTVEGDTGSSAHAYDTFTVNGTASTTDYRVTVQPGTLKIKPFQKAEVTVETAPTLTGVYGTQVKNLSLDQSNAKVVVRGTEQVVHGTWNLSDAAKADTTVLTVGANNTVNLVFTPAFPADYKGIGGEGEDTCPITPVISKKPVTIAVKDQNKDWGETLPIINTGNLLENAGDVPDDLKGEGVMEFGWKEGITNSSEVGTYPGAVVLNNCTINNYAITLSGGTLTVNKVEAKKIADLPAITGTYGDTIADLDAAFETAQDTVSVKRGVNGDGSDVPGKWHIVTGSGVSDNTILKPRTTQKLTLHFVADSNPDCYNVADITDVVPTIEKKDVSITINNYVRQQRTSNPASFNFTVDNPDDLVSGDTISDLGVTISCPYSATAQNCAAGLYPLKPGISENTNYNVTVHERTAVIPAGKKAEEVSEEISIAGKTYNDIPAVEEIPKNAGILVVTGFVKRIPVVTETPTVTAPYGTTLENLYKYVKGGKCVDPENSSTEVKGSWRVSGILNNGNTDPITSTSANKDRILKTTESEELVIVFYPSNSDYYSNDDGDVMSRQARTKYVPVTIEPKKITLTVADETITRGEGLPTFKLAEPTATQRAALVETEYHIDAPQPIEHIASTLVSDFGIEFQPETTSTDRSGTYRIDATSTNPNYDITFAPGTLTINKQTLKAVKITTAPTLTGEYGTTVSNLTLTDGTVKELKNAETGETGVTVQGQWALVQESNEIPHVNGTKPYTIKFTPEDDETYKGIETEVLPTLTRRPCTITAQDATRMYGKANPAFTYYADGLLDADKNAISLKLATTATEKSTVGEYPITVTATSDDYDFTFVNGTLTVTEYVLKTTTVEQQPVLTGYYGDTARNLTITGGRVTSDAGVVPGTWTVTDTATDSLTVGTTRTISMHFTPKDSATYDGATANVVPIINKRPITVGIDSKTMKQGAALPALTWYIYSGTLASWDTKDALGVTVKTDATSASPNGTYTISGSYKSDNYAVTFRTGTLTISATGTTGANTTNGNATSTTGGTGTTGTTGGSGTSGGTTGTTGTTGSGTTQGQNFGGVYFDGAITTTTSSSGGVTTTTRGFDDNSGNISMEAVTKSDGTGTQSEVDVYYPSRGLSNVRVVITKNTLQQARALSNTDNSNITLHVDAAGGQEVSLTFKYNDDPGTAAYIYQKNGDEYVMTTKKASISALSSGSGVLLPAGEYVMMTGADATAANNAIVASVSTNKTKVSVKAGKTSKVSLKGTGKSSVKSVKYTTSNRSVAKVSSTGKVTGVKKGTATVTAKITFKNGSTKRVKVKISVSK